MKRNARSDKESYFLSPDPFMKNQPGPTMVTFKVLNQLLPFHYMISGFLFSVTLFFIPLGTLFLAHHFFDFTTNLMPIIISSSLFFCFYCLLFGFLIINARIPFLKEWKEKLGFTEV